MNITFLIGNGFDLNLGLKTSYKDFYNYYTKTNPRDMIANAINADYELWSDLELGLGEFLREIGPYNLEAFLDSKELLEKSLADYLLSESNKVTVKDEQQTRKELESKIPNFYKEFSAVEQARYEVFLSNTAESIKYCFINFNYTDVLDRIIKTCKNSNSLSSHVCKRNNTGYNDYIIQPIHIHGDTNKDLVLGVNDDSQIGNENLRNNQELLDCVIKERLNAEIGELKTETVKDIINNSKYVCVFGMSIGSTDNLWWRTLIEWVLQDVTNRIVLYVYDNTIIRQTAQKKVRTANVLKKQFAEKNKSLSDEQKEQLRKQIIFIPNSDIFNFKSVKLEEQNGQDEDAE
jgi:hypothetical protein